MRAVRARRRTAKKSIPRGAGSTSSRTPLARSAHRRTLSNAATLGFRARFGNHLEQQRCTIGVNILGPRWCVQTIDDGIQQLAGLIPECPSCWKTSLPHFLADDRLDKCLLALEVVVGMWPGLIAAGPRQSRPCWRRDSRASESSGLPASSTCSRRASASWRSGGPFGVSAHSMCGFVTWIPAFRPMTASVVDVEQLSLVAVVLAMPVWRGWSFAMAAASAFCASCSLQPPPQCLVQWSTRFCNRASFNPPNQRLLPAV